MWFRTILAHILMIPYNFSSPSYDSCTILAHLHMIPYYFSSSSYDASRIPGKDVWIDCEDRQKSKSFVWGDGVAVSWSNWQSGQPNNYWARKLGTQHCCEMQGKYNMQWNDEMCQFKNSYVCQAPTGDSLSVFFLNINVYSVMKYTPVPLSKRYHRRLVT